MQGRDGHARGTRRRLGNAQPKSDGAAAVRRAPPFLAAVLGSRARSRAWALIEMGRVARSAGAPGAHSLGSRAIFGGSTRERRAGWEGNFEKRVAHRGGPSRI